MVSRAWLKDSWDVLRQILRRNWEVTFLAYSWSSDVCSSDLYYKSVEMLKQFKSYNTCPDMFRFHAGTIIREQSCAWLKLQIWFLPGLVDMDSVNAMAAYRLVVQACVNARLHNKPICRHNIE
jgi:hypothetical protein